MQESPTTSLLPSVLTTERLVLRSWQDADYEPFSAMSADPEVMAHLLALPSPQAISDWINRQLAHLAANGFCFWVVESKESGEFMGAAGAALQFGFEHLGLTEIVANTVPSNHNSRRVMEKLGMSNDRTDDFDHPLVPEDHPLRRQMLYRLPRSDWSSQRRS